MLLPYPCTDVTEGTWLPISEELFPTILPGNYLISNYGIVHDLYLNSYLPQNIYYEKDKYITVCLQTVTDRPLFVQPHRLVGLHFLWEPGCEYKEINHKDCVKYHNWSWNLEWVTHKDNMKYAYEHNSFKRGEDRKLSKLSNDEVRHICSLIDQNVPTSDIVELYDSDNINIRKTITNIKTGHCWRFISKDYKFASKYLFREGSTTSRKT